MATGVTWILMLAAGIGSLWLMKRTPPLVDWFLERFAACCIVGAGSVTATGWLGGFSAGITDWATANADQAGRSLLGVGVVWIIAAALGIMWIGAFLPNRWARWGYPNWLIGAGFFLPLLLASVPGELGEVLRIPIEWAGTASVTSVRSIIT